MRRLGVVDTITILPPVRVEGRRGLAPGRTTATYVRLDRAEVIRFLPGTATDALLVVPGVDLVKTGPWASRLSVRGLSGDRVLVLVDGVRLNTARGHGAQPSLIGLDRLDGVEVLPGANSTLFGSDALGGVVNLVTHRSLFAADPALSLALAGRGLDPGRVWSQSARARLVGSTLGFEVFGALGGRDALVTPEGTVPNSGDRERDLTARLAGRWRSTVLDYEHAHHAALDVGLPAFNSSAGAGGKYPFQGRDADRLELLLPGRRARPHVRILGATQALRTEFTETTVDSVFFRGNFAGTRTEVSADDVRTRVRSLQASLHFERAVDLRLLGELRREEAAGPRTTRLTVRDRAGAVTSAGETSGQSMPAGWREGWALGAHASHQWHGLRLEGGVRFNDLASHADSTSDSFTTQLDARDRHWSGEAGASHAVGPITGYLHIASGFRTPNLEELYYNNDIHGGLRLYGNPELRTERSRSYEAGLRIGETFGGWVREARASGYRSEVEDLIGFRHVALVNGVPRFQYVNVERARIEGMEYTIGLQAGRVRIGLNAAFPRGFDLETGQRLHDIGTARALLDVTLPVDGLIPYGALAARVRWNDAVWSRDTTWHRPAFSTLSFEASSVVAGVRAVVAVQNLLDASYREPMSFIREPGRTYALSLRHEFTTSFRRARRSS